VHKEDIKSALRKQYGSLRRFEMEAHIALDSTKDVLRGRRVTATEKAIARAIGEPLHVLFPLRYATPEDGESTTVDNTDALSTAHRLNEEAA